MTAAIELEGLRFGYGDVPLLNAVTLSVGQGGLIGILGPNGGGKSTLLRLLLGLLEPEAGRVRVLGRCPRAARREMGYVPQTSTLRRDFPITVAEAVQLGRLERSRPFGGFTAEDRRRALGALRRVRIDDQAQRPIEQLSGGQFQRMLLARALVAEPRLLLLDEPTSSLDAQGKANLYELFIDLSRHSTVLAVSHEASLLADYASRLLRLDDGRVTDVTAEGPDLATATEPGRRG